jgi:hypothetical protein
MVTFLQEGYDQLDVWIFEWGRGLVILVYLKKTKEGANIDKKKGA